jgi:tetratricopeptide (TPR) repeat protein
MGINNSETFLQLGWFSFNRGKWHNAISYFENGLSRLPSEIKSIDALYALARMYENMGDKQKAIENYWKLLPLIEDENPLINKVTLNITSLEEKTE